MCSQSQFSCKRALCSTQPCASAPTAIGHFWLIFCAQRKSAPWQTCNDFEPSRGLITRAGSDIELLPGRHFDGLTLDFGASDQMGECETRGPFHPTAISTLDRPDVLSTGEDAVFLFGRTARTTRQCPKCSCPRGFGRRQIDIRVWISSEPITTALLGDLNHASIIWIFVVTWLHLRSQLP